MPMRRQTKTSLFGWEKRHLRVAQTLPPMRDCRFMPNRRDFAQRILTPQEFAKTLNTMLRSARPRESVYMLSARLFIFFALVTVTGFSPAADWPMFRGDPALKGI